VAIQGPPPHAYNPLDRHVASLLAMTNPSKRDLLKGWLLRSFRRSALLAAQGLHRRTDAIKFEAVFLAGIAGNRTRAVRVVSQALRNCPCSHWRRADMPGNLLYYAIVLIVVAIVAALLGFGGVASTAMGGAHLLIWVAVVILIVGVVFALVRRV
jgi:uncharacterized membrane protein YtjA (UPF0391 family)